MRHTIPCLPRFRRVKIRLSIRDGVMAIGLGILECGGEVDRHPRAVPEKLTGFLTVKDGRAWERRDISPPSRDGRTQRSPLATRFLSEKSPLCSGSQKSWITRRLRALSGARRDCVPKQ